MELIVMKFSFFNLFELYIYAKPSFSVDVRNVLLLAVVDIKVATSRLAKLI